MPREIPFDEALKRAKGMSEKYVARGPYRFFPVAEVVESVQEGLAKNLVKHGHLFCP